MAMTAVVVCYCKPSPFLGRLPSRSFQGHWSSMRSIESSAHASSFKAIFWGSKKTMETRNTEISLGDFTLTETSSEEVPTSQMKPKKISVSVVSSISQIASNDWDACALDATGPEKFNPFISHGFLSSLEESASAVKETGWIPQHIVAKDECENILGVVPLYLKSHSYGEYVFDHSWADAYYSYGARYYPKLQCCIPFTPVTGQRILIRDVSNKDQVFDILISALKELAEKYQVSSLHVTFPAEKEWQKMREKGFLQRVGMQYHWKNRNYKKVTYILCTFHKT